MELKKISQIANQVDQLKELTKEEHNRELKAAVGATTDVVIELKETILSVEKQRTEMNIDVSTLKSKMDTVKVENGEMKVHAKTVIENECKYGTID